MEEFTELVTFETKHRQKQFFPTNLDECNIVLTEQQYFSITFHNWHNFSGTFPTQEAQVVC